MPPKPSRRRLWISLKPRLRVQRSSIRRASAFCAPPRGETRPAFLARRPRRGAIWIGRGEAEGAPVAVWACGRLVLSLSVEQRRALWIGRGRGRQVPGRHLACGGLVSCFLSRNGAIFPSINVAKIAYSRLPTIVTPPLSRDAATFRMPFRCEKEARFDIPLWIQNVLFTLLKYVKSLGNPEPDIGHARYMGVASKR